MCCSDFEQRLQELLDARQQPEVDVQLSDHAADCRACCEILAAQARLFGGLAGAGCPAPPYGFPERVVGIALADRRRRRYAPLIAVAALAATLFLVVWPTGFTNSRTELAAIPGGFPGLVAASRPGFGEHSEIDAEQYRAIIQGLIIQVNRFPQIQRVDEIAGSIRPLASTLNVAIDLLWRRTFSGGSDDRSRTDFRESRVRSWNRRSISKHDRSTERLAFRPADA